jgi:hypothetical protein
MAYDLSAALVYAAALAVFGMLVIYGIPLGALSISRSIAAYRARRARHLRRVAFHRRLRAVRPSARDVSQARTSRQGT